MQVNFSTKKTGVSLIIVLLFMMIATIAATATWKFLSSEGFSSTSRMLKREAYQSAQAGIENARSWMTFHANDVGAIIRQYIDGGNKPINLDSRLRTLQRAGQNYHVWLTGVNVEGPTYKLKIYSAGEARNNAKHNEVAIFNVDGLYRVDIPQVRRIKANDFDYNYFGGTTINHGDIFARSMLVNGDLIGGNPASIDSNLIITGNFKVSGNSVAVHGTACIGGNLDADNGIVGNNFYVHGNLDNLKIRALTANKGNQTVNLGNSIYGNLYVNGNITKANGNQVIDGNLTLKGTWTTNMRGYNAGVRGDLCVEGNGQILFPNLDREFKASGNVWMESNYPIWTGNENYDKYKRIVIGSNGTDVYMKTGFPWNDYKALREANVFTETADEPFGWGGTGPQNDERKWGKAAGPGAGPGKVDEVYKDVFKNKAEKPGLAYLYNWNSSSPVDLSSYTDQGHNLLVYKLNGEWFWDTWHDNSYKSINYSGNSITGSPYCGRAQGGLWGPAGSVKERARPACGVAPWFKVDGTFRKPFPNSRPSDLPCASSVKTHCDEIWEDSDGCGTAQFLVPDPLVTGISFFESFENKSDCVKNIVNGSIIDVDFSKFNKCYTEALAHDQTNDNKILYNKYLVVKITNKNIFASSKGLLQGKFIFIFERDLNQNMKIPPTAGEGTYVFMYFKDGWRQEIVADNGPNYNYFIYTKNDIKTVLFNQNILKGSVYAAVRDEATGAKKCAKVRNLTFNKGMEFDSVMVNDLTNSGVICRNDGSVCGGIFDGPSPTPGSSSSSEDSDEGKDSLFISMAPQLSIHVESMYETRESQPKAENLQELQSSYIVLPRVIYLPSDPYGELKDYYNFLALNVSSNETPLKKEDIVNYVTCSGPGAISTSGKLFSGSTLSQGVYRCEVTPPSLERRIPPFWVEVGSSSRGAGEVSFETPYQSLAVTQTTPVPVNLLVSPHSTELRVSVNCPSVPSAEWSYEKNSEFLDNTASDGCTFKIPPSSENGSYKLFEVTTAGATSGRLTFTLKTGEGYTLASPYYTDLVVSSIANISRVDLTPSEIEAYCNSPNHSCPTDDYYSWPNCSYTGLWVEPEGGATSVVTNDLNEMWSVSIGGAAGTIELKDRSNGKCVVIIPEKTSNGNDNKLQKSAMEANENYSLYASAKALTRTLKVVFKGVEGSGKIPVINYQKASNSNGNCTYSGDGLDHACAIPVYDGEEILLSIDPAYTDNENFSYWQCSGINCPNTEPIRSSVFDAFKVKDNATAIYVHFGESDKHCFFDEFKNGSVECSNMDVEYCVDKCEVAEDAVCVDAIDPKGVYTKAKWHLLSGKLGDIDNSAEYISIKNARKTTRGVNNKNNKIKVISTVTAGINGTMKALFRMPRATSSYGISSENIVNSGFMLRSDVSGTEYLMLNIFVNKKGYMEAQVCTDAGSCLNGELVKNGLPKSVSTTSMVMMSATLNTQNQLVVNAFTSIDYNDSPEEYSYTFNLVQLTNSYANRAHEYVGFSLADPNFKLYGIGWESEDYQSECWNVPPTIKCSFAAKAQNGVIELEKDVVPWIGHSDWFDSKDCTPHYYYYKGNDASCGNAEASGLKCSSGYNFNADGQGLHGYGDDIKTAKVSLYCPSVNKETEEKWLQSAGRVHCGTFWTGKFTECSENYPALLANVTLQPMTTDLTEVVMAQGTRYNLRGATINVSLSNSDNNEVELVLVSKHDFNTDYAGFNLNTIWGDYKGNTIWGKADNGNGIFLSNAVKITGNTASFDVLEDLAKGAEGFDPENVRSIILMNHGTTPVTVSLISSSCRNAVSVGSCKAEYKDERGEWEVTAHINNIGSDAAVLTLNKKIGSGTGDNFVCGTQGVSCDKDTETGIATYTITDNPYIHQGEHYYFTMSVSNGNVTDTRDCDVTPDPIGSITRECGVNLQSVQAGKGVPQFQFTLYGCPSSGCKYNIRLGDESERGTATSGVQVKKTFDALNTESANLSVGEYTYRVVQDGDETPFSECTATFSVTEKKAEEEEVSTTCSIEGVNNSSLSAGGQGKFTFVVNNGSDINISGRNYELEFPDGSKITGNTGTNSSQSVTFTVPAVGGNVTLRVWDKTEYKESCTSSLALSDLSVTCGVSNNYWGISGGNTFYTTENLYFMAKNNVSVAGEITVSVLKNGDADGTGRITNWGNWNSVKNIGRLDAGDYTYKLQYGGIDICSHSITVANPLTCSVSAETIGLGEAFTLTTTYGGNCWESTLSGSPSSGNGVPSSVQRCQSSYSITPSAKGTYEYTYSVTNGSLGATSCKKTVIVSAVAPSFSCVDNLKATVNTDNNVQIRLTEITGCPDDDACNYTISGTGAVGTTVYTGCTNTNCTLPRITNKTTASGKTETYAVTLTNTIGNKTKNCSVEFIEGATCHCEDYCSSGCKNLQVAGSGFNDASQHCLFITGARVIRLTGKNNVMDNTKLNGVSLTGVTKCENATECETLLSNYTKQDGGYYIWLDSWNYAHLEGATGTSVCSIGSDGPIEKQESFAVNTTGVEVTIKGSESPSGCQIQCSVSGNPGNVSVYIGNTEVASGYNSAGNNIDASYCAGGAKWTVKASNVAVTSCYFNWW